ncbi:beta-class carbonic anhydrase [Paenisporosarcina cavernae]|uniref:carbonic anhydrase n=1 Tax=Paenisporosarcina cavernae TaxID=2320858 RepID=A0A385YTQ2_9BACL|nr:carbonic anhydrase [Paenisporosarcina cavernae]AYC30255.1 carbonic anhydrase [Paenisporosarcina cavernae]
MSTLQDILSFNEQFVENKEYEPYITTKFPDKKMVILTCMDTRLVELLPKAMNVKNGDIKMVKSAGAVINHPFGGIMRSLLVAVYELKAEEIYVVGHYDCGMSSIKPEAIKEKIIDRGISKDTFDTLANSGIDVDEWLQGFDNVADSVRHSIHMIRKHPLMVKDIPVHGLVIDPATGKLDLVETDEHLTK